VADIDAAVDHDGVLSAARATGFAPDQAQVVVSGLCAACQGE
jgi:hypothetical protein